MQVISRRFRFNGYWEFVMVDGQFYILVKDILWYFGYKRTSHKVITELINDDDRLIIKGKATHDMKHVEKGQHALLITKAGLMTFIYNRLKGEKREKGIELLQWINEKAIPEMKEEWEKFLKINGKDSDFEEQLITDDQKHPDLFDMALEQQIEELKYIQQAQEEMIHRLQEKLAMAEKRIEALERALKQEKLEKAVVDGERKLIDVDQLINYLKGVDAGGHIR